MQLLNMSLLKSISLIALLFIGLECGASDSLRVNALNRYIAEKLAKCLKVDADSLRAISSIELSSQQQAFTKYNNAQSLYCAKKFEPALSIVDSLLQLPTELTDDLLKVKLSLCKGRILRNLRRYDEAFGAFDETIVLAKLIKSQKVEGLCHYYKGRIFETTGNFLEAITSYHAGVVPLLNSKKQFVGELYKSAGIVYRKMGINTEAIKQYTLALENYQTTGNTYGIAAVYNSMANLWIVEQELEKAEEYLNRALEYNGQIEDGRSIRLNVKNNFGILFNDREDFELAIEVLNEALELAKRQQNLFEASLAIGNLAIAYKGIGNYNQAISYYHKSLKLKKLSRQQGVPLNNLLGLGNAHFRAQDLDSAKYYYNLVGSAISPNENPRFLVTYYDYLATYYKATKEWTSAFDALDSSAAVASRGSLNEQKSILASYEALFNTKAKEYEKLILEKTVESEKEKVLRAKKEARMKNILFIASLCAFFLVSIFALIIIYNKRKLENANRKLSDLNERLKTSVSENKALVGIVAHDLKTPINQFKGLIDLIKEGDGSLSEEQTSYVTLMEQVASEGTKVVNDLVLANRAEMVDIKLSEIEVCELLNNAKNRFKGSLKEKQISLSVECSIDVRIVAEEPSLNRVLDNLISNAIKFSYKGSSITIGAKVEMGKKLVYVEDKGPGIPDNDIPNLFKRYTKLTAKPTSGESSTGLGLFIVKTLANKMKASIDVKTELGKGTRFTVVFEN